MKCDLSVEQLTLCRHCAGTVQQVNRLTTADGQNGDSLCQQHSRSALPAAAAPATQSRAVKQHPQAAPTQCSFLSATPREPPVIRKTGRRSGVVFGYVVRQDATCGDERQDAPDLPSVQYTQSLFYVTNIVRHFLSARLYTY